MKLVDLSFVGRWGRITRVCETTSALKTPPANTKVLQWTRDAVTKRAIEQNI